MVSLKNDTLCEFLTVTILMTSLTTVPMKIETTHAQKFGPRAPTRAASEPVRQHAGVLRLHHFRAGSRVGVPQSVLPPQFTDRGVAQRICDLCGRFRRPADR